MLDMRDINGNGIGSWKRRRRATPLAETAAHGYEISRGTEKKRGKRIRVCSLYVSEVRERVFFFFNTKLLSRYEFQEISGALDSNFSTGGVADKDILMRLHPSFFSVYF